MVKNKYQKYVRDIKHTLKNVLDDEISLFEELENEPKNDTGGEDDFSLQDPAEGPDSELKAKMEANGMEDDNSPLGDLTMGDELSGEEKDGLKPVGSEDGGGEEISKKDKEDLERVDLAAEKKDKSSVTREKRPTTVATKEEDRSGSTSIKEKRDMKKKVVKEETKIHSDIKNVARGKLAKNKNDVEWEDLIAKIIDSITVVSDENERIYKELKKENEDLREELNKLNSFLLESVRGIRNVLRESALHIAKNEYIVAILSEEKIPQSEKVAFVQSINESETVEEAKRYYKHFRRLKFPANTANVESKNKSVSPLRLNGQEQEKIRSYLKKRAEEQDTGSSKRVLEEQGLPLPVSVERLQELAGVQRYVEED